MKLKLKRIGFERPRAIPAAATGALAVGTMAIGSFAIGAVAVGALAIGALSIGRLLMGRVRIQRLEIDELVVRRIRVIEHISTPSASGAGSLADESHGGDMPTQPSFQPADLPPQPESVRPQQHPRTPQP